MTAYLFDNGFVDWTEFASGKTVGQSRQIEATDNYYGLFTVTTTPFITEQCLYRCEDHSKIFLVDP